MPIPRHRNPICSLMLALALLGAPALAQSDAPGAARSAPTLPESWTLLDQPQPGQAPIARVTGRDLHGRAEAILLLAFCVEGKATMGLALDPDRPGDDLILSFGFAGAQVDLAAIRTEWSQGLFLTPLDGGDLVERMAAGEPSMALAVEGQHMGWISLTGAAGALTTALAGCGEAAP